MAQNIQPDRPIWPSVPDTGLRSGRGSFESDTHLDREGARVHGPVDQRDFLMSLGLLARAERLKQRASPAQGMAIDAAVARLTDPGRRGMGRLFKVMALSAPGLSTLPGLPTSPGL